MAKLRSSRGCGLLRGNSEPRRRAFPRSYAVCEPTFAAGLWPFAAVNDPGIEGRNFRNTRPMGLIGVVPGRREPSGSGPDHTPTGIWQPDRRAFAPLSTRESRQRTKPTRINKLSLPQAEVVSRVGIGQP